MDKLKVFLSHESDDTIITDYDFNILWENRKNNLFSYCGSNCAAYFESEAKPLSSGDYYILYNNVYHKCNVVNYTELNVYVIKVSSADVVLSAVRQKGVTEMLINQSAAIRDMVTGISFSNELLRKKLSSEQMDKYLEYNDIITGNCCKMLKETVSVSEFINYAAGNIEAKKIDFSLFVNNLIDDSADVLDGKVTLVKEIEDELFINVDADRLTTFILSLISVVYNNNPQNNIMYISAKKHEDFVSLTISPDSNGTDNVTSKFSQNVKLYKGDEADSRFYIINQFCKTFNASLYILGNSEDVRSISVKIPFDYSDEPSAGFESTLYKYSEGVLSKLKVILSDVLF